jgi:predicted membrane metal-binding protein
VVLGIIVLLPPLRRWVQARVAPDPLLPEELLPRWRRWGRAPARYAGDLLLTSFAAWVGSVPLVAWYFHVVTPVSTPANLVAVPLCGLVLVSDLAGLLTMPWFAAAAELFNHAGWFLMECIRVSSHWFPRWPGAC